LQEEKEAREAEKEARKAEEAAKKELEGVSKASLSAEASGEPAADIKEEPSVAVDDAKMTEEQLGELADALSILTAKSSIVKERDELRALLEDNLLSEAVRINP
jgi:LETM1 and EF-hand domain-containing protein 1, mitochondrial